jgi:hypothetical protein
MQRLVNVADQMDRVFERFEPLGVGFRPVRQLFQIERDGLDDAEALAVALGIVAFGIIRDRHVVIGRARNAGAADLVGPHDDVAHVVRALKREQPLQFRRGGRRQLVLGQHHYGAVGDAPPGSRGARAA